MLKFSQANIKLRQLESVVKLQPFLRDNRKVYSFDSGRSGWTCPFAQDCLSKVKIIDGKKKIVDGPKTKFRCFSASQEVLFSNVYNSRKHNEDILKSAKNKWDMAKIIVDSLPTDSGIVRINVAGDIFNQEYFDALIIVANSCQSTLFYAYTKSLPYWIRRINDIPDNLVLTASYGGRYDNLIAENNLRYAKVVFSENEASRLGLEIDHTDEHAAIPSQRNQSFSLLLHGVQPKNTRASEALKLIKRK